LTVVYRNLFIMATIRQLVIMGGKGGGTIAAEAAISASAAGAPYTIEGFLNDRIAQGEMIYGFPVLGGLENWRLLSQETVFIPALHNVVEMRARLDRVRALGVPPDRWMTVRHPHSSVAQDVSLGRGVFVGPFAVVEPGARIGDFVSIRSGAYVSHETNIGDFVFVGANSTVAGRSVVGQGTHIGPNAVIRDRLKIADFTTIGIGAVVTKSIESAAIIAGNPARPLPRSSYAC
jgi:acetyltransferase EpsM